MTDRIFSLVLGSAMIMITLLSCQKDKSNTWQEILTAQLAKYPESQPQDIYKFVYQGVLGPYHLTTEKEKMIAYLRHEYQHINADSSIPLIEKIAPDDRYIRINLKAYKAKNYDLSLLGDILFKSCQPGDQQHLISTLDEIDNLIMSGRVFYHQQQWQPYYAKIKTENYFTPHHSQQYIEAYDPAYRVVAKNIWNQFFSD